MKRRADGRWMRYVTLGSGKRVAFYSTAKTEASANRDINLQIAAYKEEDYSAKHNFKELSEAVLEEKYKTTAYHNASANKAAFKSLSIFYDMPIEDITPTMVQSVLNDMASKGYSFSSVTKAKIFFGMVIKYAMLKYNLPLHDFMSAVKVPKTVKKGIVKSPPDDIIKTVMNSVYSARYGEWAVSLLCLGLRRGELAGLQRRDVNLESREVYLNHSVEYVSNVPRLKPTPKTIAGIRVIPIIDAYFPIIAKLCDGLKEDEFLFGKEKPLTEIAIRRRWETYTKDIGYKFNGHQLRHAYAKLLYKAGVDPKTAQALLGHSDFQTTMNIYTDFDEEMNKSGGQLLNNFINSSMAI